MIRLGVVAALIIIVLLLMPKKEVGDHGNKYEVQTTMVQHGSKAQVSQVFLLMDPSGSMKGYLDFAGYPDARKNLVNNICKPLDCLASDYQAELKVKYGTKGQFDNVNISAFREKMIKGESFNDATTMLDAMISDAVSHVSDTTVSMIVSDMVLSYGSKMLADKKDNWLNKHNLSDLGATIHSALKAAPNVEVLLLQYYSDFNGKYYYNCTENKENGAQYKNSLMLKRPYYIMVLGSRDMLMRLLDDGVFAKWENLYASFGLNDANMTTQKLNLQFSSSSSWLWDNSTEDPNAERMGTVWTTAALESQKETFTVEFNKFDIPAFLNQNYEIGDYHLSDVIESIRETTQASNPNLLRFEVTMKPFDRLPEVGDLEFTLISRNNWVEGASTEDDVNLENLSDLEGKTWGLSTIIENIDLAHYGKNGRPTDVVATVHFKVSKK